MVRREKPRTNVNANYKLIYSFKIFKEGLP